MIADIRKTLTEQVRILSEFAGREQSLQEAVLRREWPAVDACVRDLETRSRIFRALDEKRHALVSSAKVAAGLRADAPFAQLAEAWPDLDRSELLRLHRSLQVSVLKVKSVTRGLDAYVRGSLRAAQEILGELYPDQKGTFYSRGGRRAPADSRAIVVDRHL